MRQYRFGDYICKDVEEYHKLWGDVIVPLEKFFNCRVLGYDPGIGFGWPVPFTMPLEFGQKIIKLLESKQGVEIADMDDYSVDATDAETDGNRD